MVGVLAALSMSIGFSAQAAEVAKPVEGKVVVKPVEKKAEKAVKVSNKEASGAVASPAVAKPVKKAK